MLEYIYKETVHGDLLTELGITLWRVAAAFVVSLRFLMYSAAVAPHLAHLGLRWRLLLSYLMTDQSFASTVRRYEALDDFDQDGIVNNEDWCPRQPVAADYGERLECNDCHRPTADGRRLTAAGGVACRRRRAG